MEYNLETYLYHSFLWQWLSGEGMFQSVHMIFSSVPHSCYCKCLIFCTAVSVCRGLHLFPFLGSLLSRWPSQRKDSKLLSSSFFFSFSLCQIGAGQFHPLHVSVICASVCSLKHICVCFKAKTKAKLWSWGFRWLVPSLKMFLSLVDTVLVLYAKMQVFPKVKAVLGGLFLSAVSWLHDLHLSAFIRSQKLWYLSLLLFNTVLSGRGQEKCNAFCKKE